MEKLTFELEFITPAFIGGALKEKNGNEEITLTELRPASFIGLLRWWWRALKVEEDIRKLYEKESRIFGGYLEDKEAIAIASKVWLKIKSVDGNKFNKFGKDLKKDLGLNWYFNKEERTLKGRHAGIGYVFFSQHIPQRIKDKKVHKIREFYLPGTTFCVELILEDPSIKKDVLSSFWALIYFGGVGFRSRRGGGNLAVINSPYEDFISFKPNKENFETWLKEQWEKIYTHFGQKSLISKIIISKKQFNNWVDALNEVGAIYMDYRKENRRKLVDMGAFGLPIRHQNCILIAGIGDNNKVREELRRASPLILKVVKIDDKSYRWMLIKLNVSNDTFLPRNVKLYCKEEKKSRDKGKKEIKYTPKGRPNLKVIDEFIDKLVEEMNVGMEVSL